MGEPTHTPGPWWGNYAGNSFWVEDGFDMEVCTVTRRVDERGDYDDQITRDHMALIAAAPDLLGALETVLEDYDLEHAQSRRAIAKARGEA